jgi:hypothetical protein
MRQRRIQADGFAIIAGSILKFSSVEESRAVIEANIRILRL